MKPSHFIYALLFLCLSIWSADLYYESGAARQPQIAEAPAQTLIGSVEASLGFQRSPLAIDADLKDLLSSYTDRELGIREKTAQCEIAGPLPDKACTPGAVFPEAATSTICQSGYTKTVRSVSVSLKKKVYAEYGISYPQPTGSYEVDHLIPLELGGSNDIANLFPEAAEPQPGFKEKDLVENYLHLEVCAGNVDLGTAQRLIADDWLAVYNGLSPQALAYLKEQYKSWAK